MERFRNYNMKDTRGFWGHVLLQPDQTAADLDKALTVANAMLRASGLEGQILPGHLIDMAARSIVEGSGDNKEPGTLKMDKLINSLPYVAARLLEHRGDLKTAMDARSNIQDRLTQLPVSTADALTELENQFIRQATTPTRRAYLRDAE
jgi:hypothetical protein